MPGKGAHLFRIHSQLSVFGKINTCLLIMGKQLKEEGSHPFESGSRSAMSKGGQTDVPHSELFW